MIIRSLSETSVTSSLSYTILIVATAIAEREVYHRSLQTDLSCAYTILEADSVTTAIEICQNKSIDGILVDRVTGVELIQELQARLQDRRPAIVFVENDPLITADRAAHHAVRAIKLGAEDYLIKQTLMLGQLPLSMRSAIEAARSQSRGQKEPASCSIEAQNQELRDRVTELQTLIDLAPVGIGIATDPSCAYMRHNAYLREILGVRPGCNISKSAPAEEQPNFRVMRNGQEIPPEDLPMQIAARLGVDVRDTEFEIVLPDGTVHHLLCYASPVRGDRDEIKGSIGIFLNITDAKHREAERQRMEAELRESHEQLTNTLESITDAFFSLDESWQFTFVNPQAEKLLKKTQADLIGKNLWSEFPEAVGSEFDQAYRRAITERVTVQFEAFYPPLEAWFEVRAYPTRNGLAIYFRDVTPRKAAEAEREYLLQQERAARTQVEDLLHQLAIEQNRLEQVLQQMPIGVSIVDAPSGKLRFFNGEATRLLGHPLLASDTYEGYGQYGAIHADGQPYQSEEYPTAKSLLSREVVKAEEMLYRRGDGTNTVLSVSAAPIFDPTGAMTSVVCTFEDIVDRKQTEARLHASEERLRLALKATGIGIWDWDTHQNHVTWAGENEKLFGLPQGSFEGTYEAFLNRVHPDDRSSVEQSIAEVFQEKRGYIQEFRIVYPDGTVRWLRTQSELFLDDQGNSLRLIGTNHDITDQKHAETALRESEARYRALADMIPQFVWMSSASGVNEYVNHQFCEYSGKGKAELLDLDWMEVIHPDDREKTRERWLGAVQSGEFYTVEYRLRRFDGTYRWFLGKGQPLRNEQGQIMRWFGTCTDIHDQKQIEIERAQLLAAAEVARSQAEAASRMKDEFLAIVSHELRSPLNAMLGWAKLLRGGKLNDMMREKAVQVIERNAEAQTQLIEDLLDISRIIRGKVRLNLAPVNLVQVIDAAIDTVRPSAQIKQIQIESQLEPSAALVQGDLDRLQQVVWNLLSNAVKFTPEVGRVTIALSQVGNQAQIRVTDTGKGINSDFLPYVFDRFRQAENSTTRTTSGLGLGLAIVRSLVDMHGGTVYVESPGEGQGATFTVQLPLLAGVQACPEGEISLPNAETGSLEGVRILVVDDELDTREFLVAALEMAGATVIAAASAREGLQQVLQFHPDILVSDIGMPNEDGYTFIQRVRSLTPEQGGNIPAVALTAFARQEDRMQAIAAGFQMHVAKPIEPTRLIAVTQTLAQPKS